MKEYRELNKESQKEYLLAWSKTIQGRSKKLVRMAAARAKDKGLEYDLDWNWLHERLISGKCEATGIELEVTAFVGETPWAASIDRVDPAKGYVKTNCRVVCYMFNTAKNGFTDDEVKRFCEAYLRKLEDD